LSKPKPAAFQPNRQKLIKTSYILQCRLQDSYDTINIKICLNQVWSVEISRSITEKLKKGHNENEKRYSSLDRRRQYTCR
jgi:hypothetical protein